MQDDTEMISSLFILLEGIPRQARDDEESGDSSEECEGILRRSVRGFFGGV